MTFPNSLIQIARNNAVEYLKLLHKAWSYNASVDKQLLGFRFSVYIPREQVVQSVPKNAEIATFTLSNSPKPKGKGKGKGRGKKGNGKWTPKKGKKNQRTPRNNKKKAPSDPENTHLQIRDL